MHPCIEVELVEEVTRYVNPNYTSLSWETCLNQFGHLGCRFAFQQLEVVPPLQPRVFVLSLVGSGKATELGVGTVRNLARLTIGFGQTLQCTWAGKPRWQTEGPDVSPKLRVTAIKFEQV